MDNIHYLNLPHNEALGRIDPLEEWYARHEPTQPSGIFDSFFPIVGDAAELEALDGEPLPDEQFDWSCVEDQDREFVAEVLRRADDCCDILLDVEFRTIARRILARVAARDPRCLRRSAPADRFAAALVYLSGNASGEFGRRGRITAHRLWSWWGLSSCADRARTIRNAAGLEPEPGRSRDWLTDYLLLGDATLLHSRYREQLCRRRDYLLEHAPRPKLTRLAHGRQIEARAELVTPIFARKGVSGSRTMVMLGLGTDLDDASIFGLSITDAHELVHMLEAALAAPPPRVTPPQTDTPPPE